MPCSRASIRGWTTASAAMARTSTTNAIISGSNVDMDITKTTVVNLGVQGNVTENMEPVEGSAAIYRDIINAAPNAFSCPFQGRRAGWPRRSEQPL